MSANGAITLTVCGDLMFYGRLAALMRENGDLLWGLRLVAGALRHGDLLFGNLETPVSTLRKNEPDAPAQYFSPPGMGRALRSAGFDIVNLANNHVYDFGVEGVDSTLRELNEAGLPYLGIGRSPEEASRPVIVQCQSGVRAGFLGYTTANNALDRRHTYVACFPHPEQVARAVRLLLESAGTVVVSCHGGAQFNPYPAPEARTLARAAIEAGAALFVGHHPHVLQGVEHIGQGLAIYSLGDFAAPPINELSSQTCFVRVTMQRCRVLDYEIVPCSITGECRTITAHGECGASILKRVQQLSLAIETGRSDSLHFSTARSRFVSQYVKSWIDELRTGGPGVLIRKIRNLRRYHLQLISHALTGGVHERRGRPRTPG
jgi:poly-gamma-glutamate synthesis protein (capsule biosynthesis protein)